MPKTRARLKKRRKKDERPGELVQSGALCVAFANTAARRPDHRFRVSDPPPETLPESFAAYEDLLAWGRRMGIAEAVGEAGDALRKAAASRPADAAAVVALAVDLRGALLRVFSALANRKQPAARDLAQLNRALEAIPARQVIAGDGYCWGWAGDGVALERVLAAVAWSAGELLVSDVRLRLRRCAGRGCTRLFLLGRSPRRIYCDPKRCGSRVTSRRDFRRVGTRYW